MVEMQVESVKTTPNHILFGWQQTCGFSGMRLNDECGLRIEDMFGRIGLAVSIRKYEIHEMNITIS